MKRVLRIVLGLLLMAAITAIYAAVIGWFVDLAPEKLLAVRQLIGTATIVTAAVFVIGEAFGVERQGFYLIGGGVVFLFADLLMWFGLGIHLGVRPSQHGLIPLSIIGVFLGPLFRLVTMMPRDPHH